MNNRMRDLTDNLAVSNDREVKSVAFFQRLSEGRYPVVCVCR